jgi:hypothetical protein
MNLSSIKEISWSKNRFTKKKYLLLSIVCLVVQNEFTIFRKKPFLGLFLSDNND